VPVWQIDLGFDLTEQQPSSSRDTINAKPKVCRTAWRCKGIRNVHSRATQRARSVRYHHQQESVFSVVTAIGIEDQLDVSTGLVAIASGLTQHLTFGFYILTEEWLPKADTVWGRRMCSQHHCSHGSTDQFFPTFPRCHPCKLLLFKGFKHGREGELTHDASLFLLSRYIGQCCHAL
jgi:hypothetical protein